MLKFCVVCVLITRVQGEIPWTKSYSLPGGGKWAPMQQTAQEDRARWLDNSNFSQLKCLAPPLQLPLSYVLGLCSSRGTAVCIDTRPSEYKPASQANGLESRVLRYAKGGLANAFCLNRFFVFNDEGHTVKLWAADTLLKSIQALTKSTFTPTIVTLVIFS